MKAIAGARKNSHTRAIYSHYRLIIFKGMNGERLTKRVYVSKFERRKKKGQKQALDELTRRSQKGVQ